YVPGSGLQFQPALRALNRDIARSAFRAHLRVHGHGDLIIDVNAVLGKIVDANIVRILMDGWIVLDLFHAGIALAVAKPAFPLVRKENLAHHGYGSCLPGAHAHIPRMRVDLQIHRTVHIEAALKFTDWRRRKRGWCYCQREYCKNSNMEPAMRTHGGLLLNDSGILGRVVGFGYGEVLSHR